MAGIPSNIFQVAWIVNDLESSIRCWIQSARVVPFFIIPHPTLSKLQYRGHASTLDISVAVAQAGAVQVELIEQHGEGPSPYRDVFAKGQEGMHHMCATTSDFDAEIARYQGEECEIVGQGAFADTRFAYVETRARLGFMMEIFDDHSSIKPVFKPVADAAVGWDGSNPIRYF